MGAIYRQVDADGNVIFSDTPSPALGNTEALKPDGRRAQPSATHDEVKQYIRDTQKYVPKLYDYYRYLEFLRRDSPPTYRLLTRQLRLEDPAAHAKLMALPQFQPLHQRALGWQAAERNVTAAINLATGKFTGSVEKWLESVVQDRMKQERWGGYADVLGSKATTLPTKPAEYSDSRLGQFLKGNDARALADAEQAAENLQTARSATRTGIANALGRSANVFLDLGIGALKIESFTGISYVRGVAIAEKLKEAGILGSDEALELPRMMARHEFDKVIEMINAGYARRGEVK